MRGLVHIPGETEFLRAYNALLGCETTPEFLALYVQWSRFDPRLSEIIAHWFSKYWKKISPIELNQEIHSQPWPAALGVLLEFAQSLVSENEAVLFMAWKRCCLSGVKSQHFELYFIGINKLAGKQMMKEATKILKPYKKWGFLGSEVLLHGSRNKSRTYLGVLERKKY